MSIVPSNVELAVETYVRPIDIPLIHKGEKVRVQFDGWPAIVFSGWESVSYGTYGALVVAIERNISANGKYRVLLAPDPEDHTWPEVRVGSGVKTIALLNDVSIWFEMWRQLNGFLLTFTNLLTKKQPTKNNMKKFFILLFWSYMPWSSTGASVFELETFLQLIKNEHPVAKQAQLIIQRAEANLLETKGWVDPKISAAVEQKDFKDKTYYQKIGTALKIPTWYGVEFKGAFNKASGTYLNPENNLPTQGQYQFGVSIPLGKNLFINERRVQYKQAKILVKQSAEENQLALSSLYAEALAAYIDWYSAYEKYQLNQSFVEAATMRFDGIKERVLLGDKAAV